MCNFSEEMKAEAAARMKLLHLDPELIQRFESAHEIACFEGPLGETTTLDEDDVEQIRLLEEDRNIVVYAILFGNYNIGTVASCLYVSDCQEEWKMDRQDIEKARTTGMVAYGINCTSPELSEFGYIGVDHTPNGGLKRIW